MKHARQPRRTGNPAHTLNRRDFIKRTAAGVAAFSAAPMILPRHVLGMDGTPGANNRIVVACIGHGNRGSAVARDIGRQRDATVALRVDVNKRRGEVQDFRVALDRKDIDAVLIATPEQWKAPIAISAAIAGKHIYTEKPMSYTISEGRKVVEAARRHNVVHQVGSQQRSMLDNWRGCTLIRNGAIGKVKTVKANNYPSPMNNALPGQPVPDHINWEMWCGPAPLVPYHPEIYINRGNPGWLSFREFSGGELTGWGTHGLDQIQWALGMDESGPVEIWTEGEPFKPWVISEPRPGRFHGPDAPRVFMRYDDGGEGIVVEFDGGPMGGGHFFGENGDMRIDRNAVRASSPEILRARPEEIAALPIQLVRSGNHVRNWLDSIKQGLRPCADVEIGHRSATVCHLANIARWMSEATGETGFRFKWDPKTEQFTNSPEANRLLDYERRKGNELPSLQAGA